MNASDLLARIKQTEEDSSALRAYWESALICSPPPDFDLKNLVRKFSLDHLVTGIEAYAAEISKKNELILAGKTKEVAKPLTTQNAKDYICAVAWNITEQEDPRERPVTPRRQRRAAPVPDWDAEAFENATPKERQKIMATIKAREQGKKQ